MPTPQKTLTAAELRHFAVFKKRLKNVLVTVKEIDRSKYTCKINSVSHKGFGLIKLGLKERKGEFAMHPKLTDWVDFAGMWERSTFTLGMPANKLKAFVTVGFVNIVHNGFRFHLKLDPSFRLATHPDNPNLAGTPKRSARKVGAAKKNPNWKPTAAQTRSLSPALLKGLRKYHTGR